MSSAKRFFYVVYVPEGDVRICLDAIRLIARPQARFPAHITIRGPYDHPIDTGPLSEHIRGKIVRVGDVGMFHSPLSVVFLHCSCPDFLAIWDKPEFGYTPHITLYEGESRTFASAVADLLDSAPIRFAFRASGLDALVSERAATTSPLRDRYDPAALARFLGSAPDLLEIDTMEPPQRLEWISQIARHLGKGQRTAVPA